jgi:hypothetical protein
MGFEGCPEFEAPMDSRIDQRYHHCLNKIEQLLDRLKARSVGIGKIGSLETQLLGHSLQDYLEEVGCSLDRGWKGLNKSTTECLLLGKRKDTDACP